MRAGSGAAPAGPPSGLDLWHQSSTNLEPPEPAPDGCIAPRADVLLVNSETGEVRPAGCRRLTCPACVRIAAWRRSLAIAWARPERAVTLTLVAPADCPDPWPLARRRMNRWREWCQRLGSPVGETVAHVEPNPQGTGHHAHIWQHGPKIDMDVSDEAARRAGLGWVHLERVKSARDASGYGLKGLGYGLKGTQDGPSEYLRLNGKRLTHQSRGFFRGLSVRDAEVEARRQLGESPWLVVPR